VRPIVSGLLTEDSREDVIIKQGRSSADYFEAFRNTLVTLIALFAVYLVFEISTLWFHEIPQGFYYAGYAHEGAGWLTAALVQSPHVPSAI